MSWLLIRIWYRPKLTKELLYELIKVICGIRGLLVVIFKCSRSSRATYIHTYQGYQDYQDYLYITSYQGYDNYAKRSPTLTNLYIYLQVNARPIKQKLLHGSGFDLIQVSQILHLSLSFLSLIYIYIYISFSCSFAAMFNMFYSQAWSCATPCPPHM